MKKTKWIAVFAMLCALLVCAGCKNATDDDPTPIAVESVTIDKTTLKLAPGNTIKLIADVRPWNADDKTVTWSSSDTEVATVGNDGMVTAVTKGTANIIARAGSKEAKCELTVSAAVESIMLDKETLTLKRGETYKLTTTVIPENADDKTVVWSSSDKAIATVDNDGMVTAVKVGSTTITAQGAGYKIASCKVTVPIPSMKYGKINDYGVLTEYYGNETAVVIPDGVTVIGGNGNALSGSGAFYGCVSLTNVSIPDSVTSIGGYAFNSCTNLTEVTLPCSVTSIGDYAFGYCNNLKKVSYKGTLAQWCDINWGVYSYQDSNPLSNGKAVLYINDKELTVADIPSEVTEIKKYAFYNYKSLESVTIPDSVTSIGSCAFNSCTSLKSVTIPGSVKKLGDIYGSANGYYRGVFEDCTSLTDVTISEGVESIGDCMFVWCSSLESVTIPASVTSIGKESFSKCDNLKEVVYNGTEEDWKKITIGSTSGLSGKTITGKDDITWTAK